MATLSYRNRGCVSSRVVTVSVSQVITECEDEISARGIELLREVSTCVGPQLSAAQHHEAFLTHCCARTQRLQKDMEAHEGDRAGSLTCTFTDSYSTVSL